MKITLILVILYVLVFSVGCQANPVDVGEPFEITPSAIVEFVSPNSGEPQMNPSTLADAGLQALIDKAIADLTKRLSISADQITLLAAKPVIWPDASLGCPQPGMAYVQVQEDGLLIRLQAGDQLYEYHSGGTRDPFLCLKSIKDTNHLLISIF